MKRVLYPGLLGVRPTQSPFAALAEAETNPEVRNQLQELAQAGERLRILELQLALFRHYGITDDAEHAWRALAICLAKAHVPGFQDPTPIQRRRGRPKERLPADDLDLVLYVRRLTANGMSVRSACVNAERNGHAKWKGISISALEKRYRIAEAALNRWLPKT